MSPTLVPIGALVPIGVIIRAHGVLGWVRVRPHDADSDALARAERVYLARDGEDARPFSVEEAGRERDGWLVKLEGVEDRDAAEALRGRAVLVPREELPALADDEVYVADLVGCELYDVAGALLGRVARVDNYGAQELLVVERAGDRKAEVLVPFVEPIVVSVDMEARRIVCDPPEGLFEVDAR